MLSMMATPKHYSNIYFKDFRRKCFSMIFILVLKNSPIRWLGGCLMPNEQFSTILWGEEVIIR